MQIHDTPVAGAKIIEISPISDARGFFAEGFRADEFERLGLPAAFVQISLSYNARRGTLRGMHLQLPPFEETKLVRCIRGAICDVVIDLRRGSPTFKKWLAVAENRRAAYVPAGCAHGFQTLVDDTEVSYLVSQYYTPSHYRGVRWDDPAFGVRWPDVEPRIIHDRDRSYPDFDEGGELL
jgi:dTDP-4-dehydrorhamnose 3,5-epimerase